MPMSCLCFRVRCSFGSIPREYGSYFSLALGRFRVLGCDWVVVSALVPSFWTCGLANIEQPRRLGVCQRVVLVILNNRFPARAAPIAWVAIVARRLLREIGFLSIFFDILCHIIVSCGFSSCLCRVPVLLCVQGLSGFARMCQVIVGTAPSDVRGS